MFTISCHVVAPMQTSAGEVDGQIYPPIFSSLKKPVFHDLTLAARRVSVGQNAKNAARASERDPTTPHSRRGCKASASPRRNNPKHLPPKKRPCWASSGAPRAYFCLQQHAQREPRDCWSIRAAEAMTPAQLTPNPLPDEDNAATPQDEAPTPKKEDEAPAKAIRRAKRA